MALDVTRQIAYWRDGADEALGAAELLIGNGRYNFGLFFLHLALEKMLKALVTMEIGDVPPKSHDLLLLARRANLILTSDVAVVLSEFQIYCMAGRYFDVDTMDADRRLADRELSRAKEVFKWLHRQFKK